MVDWNPTQYLAFADERTRPARDLVAQVPLITARRVYDLGCGPGNSTALLVARFPQAQVTAKGQAENLARAAVQMPDNLAEPSHRLMRKTAEHGPWAARLSSAAAARDVLPSVETYYARLKPLFRRLDIWHGIYNHPLDGVQGIVSWLEATGLRPFLSPLGDGERALFLEAYGARLADAYPLMPDSKVLLRFPRLFIVGTR